MNITSVIRRTMPASVGALRARRTGLLTMGVFTGAWSVLGLVSGVLPLQVTSCVLITTALYFLIRSAHVGAPARTDRAGNQQQRPQRSAPSDSRFMVAVIAETLAIVAAVFFLLQLRLPQYVVPLVAVIVGTHFFIFARRGDRVVHILAGIAGVTVGLVGVALIAVGTLEPVVVRGIVGCSFAAITCYYGCYFLAWQFTDGDQRENASAAERKTREPTRA